MTNRGVVFFVRAGDTATPPNVDSSAVRFVAVSLRSGELTTANTTGSAYASGFPEKQWRLISVPALMDNASMSTIIGSALGEAAGDMTWRIFEYTHNTEKQWRTAISLTPGASYWLNQWVTPNAAFDAGTGQSNNLESFNITLQPGWNMIANPYPFPLAITLDQVDFYGPLTYSGSAWSTTVETQMAPWNGYIVDNKTGANQTISLTGDVLAKQLAKAEEAAPKGWLLQLQATGETYADGGNALGRLEGATSGLDGFDNREPPFIDGYVSLAMERPDWGSNLPRFTSDIRSPEDQDGVWDLALYVKGERGPISLSTQLEGDWPPDHRIILLDILNRQEHDLLAGPGAFDISRYREDFPYHLKVVAGAADYVAHTLEKILAELPTEFALAQNYPNPFNPNTTLRYSLIQPARLTLSIYDLRGREIARLVDGWQDLGHYEIVWDGRDRFGSRASSGIYFAAYRVEGKIYTRKMVLMK